MLPSLTGFEICHAVRERGFDGAILMLTAKGQIRDRVQGLRIGADDYLVKPFDPDCNSCLSGNRFLLILIDICSLRPQFPERFTCRFHRKRDDRRRITSDPSRSALGSGTEENAIESKMVRLVPKGTASEVNLSSPVVPANAEMSPAYNV